MNTLKRLLPDGAFDLQSQPTNNVGPYISNLPRDSESNSTETTSVPSPEYESSSEPSSEPSSELSSEVSQVPQKSLSSMLSETFTPADPQVQEPINWSEFENAPHYSDSGDSSDSSDSSDTSAVASSNSSDIDWSEYENAPREHNYSDGENSDISWLAPAAAASVVSSSENTSDFFQNLLNNKVHSHYTKHGRAKSSGKRSYKKKSSKRKSSKRSYKKKASKRSKKY